jgi:hypothetical protein
MVNEVSMVISETVQLASSLLVLMSFGLCNAPGTYARVMHLVLRGLTWNIVLAFLDDILVMGKTHY